MHSIGHLRQRVIDELGLDPEMVSAFVTAGTVRSHFERIGDTPNRHFRTEYDGVLIILGFARAAEHVFWVVADWLHAHHPSHQPTAIGFDAEIIDSYGVDLKITIKGLSDTYKTSTDKHGTTILHCSNFAADLVINKQGLAKDGLGFDGQVVDKCKIGQRKND